MRYARLGKSPSTKASLLLICTAISSIFLISGCQVKPSNQQATSSSPAVAQPTISAVSISLNGAYSGLLNTTEAPEQCPDFLVSTADIERFFNRPAKRASTPAMIITETPSNQTVNTVTTTETTALKPTSTQKAYSYSINHQASNCYAAGTMMLNGTELVSWRVDKTGQGYYQHNAAVYTVQCASCIAQIDKEANQAWVAQQNIAEKEAARVKRQQAQTERLNAFNAKMAPPIEDNSSSEAVDTTNATDESISLPAAGAHVVSTENTQTNNKTVEHTP
ncbi:hypothetical protein [Neptunomonas phycophila]|uniref:hypothetical protein n=1 Tax=Neptunomonas phycophila TaxID=1572645 RepID=UPI0015BABB9F|nr:hypothetical protein [Neptunomonas phycophila]QLE98674.1 hypothetical protein FLM49_14090 [Neptunomonas phycophila]